MRREVALDQRLKLLDQHVKLNVTLLQGDRCRHHFTTSGIGHAHHGSVLDGRVQQ